MSDRAARLHELLAELTLDEKVLLVSGASFWSTHPLERIGLRAMVLSDGPSGVRGPLWDERSTSASLPSGTALASSWDPALAYRYGAAAALEARRKGVDVVLGPTINLHRSPFGGRHFEAFSEDPWLSGVLAASYVRGLQENGVAATPKHFVANDSETDRFTVDVRVDPRVLHEVYLAPFELAARAGAWAVMAAYNAVDGVTLTENELLGSPLGTPWGFDGPVISDWTAVRSLAAARARVDLAMPGPVTAWSEGLVDAVRRGEVPEAAVDRKVLRILRLADRVGALVGSTVIVPAEVDVRAFAHEAAIAGSVLLANRDELPWDRATIGSIAVIGQHAVAPRIQGGGSATVIPDRVVTPLAGIRAALPDTDLRYEAGAVVHHGVAEFPIGQVTNPATGEPGVRVTFLGPDGSELFVEDRRATALVWFDGDVPLVAAARIVLETVYRPGSDDRVELGFASSRPGRIHLDEALVLEATPDLDGADVGLTLLAPPSFTTSVDARAGVPVAVRAEFEIRPDAPMRTAASMTIGLAPTREDPDVLIERAVEAARASDVALVVVGTNSESESEGFDRTSLDLPGAQDALVRAVAAVNPRTVVVVNAGSPVLLPWRDDVAAVLLGYFGGQEMGAAIADMVLGVAEPGGRLTTTWPAAVTDVPVLDVVPTDGVLDYAEGLHIGYRAWLRTSTPPAYPFGWGLGYTSWEWRTAVLEGNLDADDARLRVTVSNTGSRPGKQVVQVYAERAHSAVERPTRWLVGWAIARVEAGGTADVLVAIEARSLAHWTSGDGWGIEPGEFTLRAGRSVTDLPLEASLEAGGTGASG